MAVKDVAEKVIDTLPEEATMENIIRALYVRTKFEHGEDEIRDGKGLSQDEACKRLHKWLK